ncbi:hypothetical protein KC356_g216 [Hortaea werneckii]|nr:hypothetical protein KC356_g216 [Hortaea werneckii]
MCVRAGGDDTSFGMYGKTPRTNPDVTLEDGFDLIGDCTNGIVGLRSTSYSLHDVAHENSLDVTIVSDGCNYLVPAQMLYDKMIDRVRLMRVQDRIPRDGLSWEPWHIDVYISARERKGERTRNQHDCITRLRGPGPVLHIPDCTSSPKSVARRLGRHHGVASRSGLQSPSCK